MHLFPTRYPILGSRLGIKEYFYQSWHMYTRGTHSKVASSNCTFHLGPAAKEAKHLWVMSAVKELNAILIKHHYICILISHFWCGQFSPYWSVTQLGLWKNGAWDDDVCFCFEKETSLGSRCSKETNWNQSGIGKKKNLFFSSKQRTV